jgi:prepilin-type processing-associated H-X9-DG protein/prepilin-type N-terminal cleavage/methylation domain-containing protein
MNRAHIGDGGGFTLVELLVVLAIIGTLVALLVPSLTGAIGAADEVRCASNLRQIGYATQLYLKDYDGWFFPLYGVPAKNAAGRDWYYGFEPNGSASLGEGNRILDRSRGKLAPYLGSVEGMACPAIPFGGAYKPKYKGEQWTYGVNRCLSTHPNNLKGGVNGNGNGNYYWIRGRDASRTVIFADGAQIVTHLPPASPSNPMVEDFPYIEPNMKYVQFRHGGQANVLFADWHVAAVPPAAGSINPLIPSAMIGCFDPKDVLFETLGKH